MNKKKVAFICVHNSCRSQIAEALGKHLASDIFESYSAGTETKPQINQDAVRIMKETYGIDMEANSQHLYLIHIFAPAGSSFKLISAPVKDNFSCSSIRLSFPIVVFV